MNLPPFLVPLRAYWTGSIRRRLAGAFGAVALGVMLFTGYLLHVYQRNFLYEQGLRNAVSLAHSLSVSSASWVAANDLVGLQEVTRGFAATPDLRFAVVVSRKGEVLSSTAPGQVGRYFTDTVSRRLTSAQAAPQVLLSGESLVDVAAPIFVGDRHLGWARVELSQGTANAHLRELTYAGLLLTAFAAMVAVLVSVLLSRRLTADLRGLVEVVGDVGSGRGSRRAAVRGGDEISVLSRDFNRMLDALEAQRADIGRRNRELAIYNEILQRITQAQPLPDILRELARQVRDLQGTPCAVFLADPEGDRLLLSATAGIPGVFRAEIAEMPLVQEAGSSTAAARQRAAVIVPDIHDDPRWESYRDWAVRADIRSCWSQPILDGGGGVLGVFTLYRTQAGAPTEAEATLIERGAKLAGLAIERQRQEERLRIAATAFESQEGLYIMDAQRTILQVNRAFTEITGFRPEEVVGQPVTILHPGDQDPALFDGIWDSVERVGSWQGEILCRRRNGEPYPKWLTLTAVRSPQGAVTHYVGGFFDITERKKAEAEIERLAFYDPLTGLPNRRLLIDRLQMELAACRRTRRIGALLFLDLDHFKTLNDSRGHDLGDLLLKKVAVRLTEHVRGSDTVARLGGDEFVVMLADLGGDVQVSENEAEHISSKLLAVLSEPCELRGTIYHGSASIGVTHFGVGDEGVEELLKQADLALYQAKAAGRNTLRFFDPAMQARISERATLEADLRRGLASGELLLHYQPQIDGTGQMTGAEALLRWLHPQHGMIPPVRFIPVAEDTGLILPLGHWVLETACRQLARWSEAPQTARLTLSINVSAR